MDEIWKPVVGYEGYYEVSDKGNVRSIDRYVKHSEGKIRFIKGKKLSTFPSTFGYSRVSLMRDSKLKSAKIHQLVARAFLPNTNDSNVVNHINGIKTDNVLHNLEWVSQKENVKHSFKIGLQIIEKGSANKKAKKVAKLNIDNDLVLEEFASMIEAEEITGIHKTSISQACRGLRKTAGGYKWKYIL